MSAVLVHILRLLWGDERVRQWVRNITLEVAARGALRSVPTILEWKAWRDSLH